MRVLSANGGRDVRIVAAGFVTVRESIVIGVVANVATHGV
jgi:hypothetical protein